MKILSIIVARSGSKGIKNKNMVKINDKPLIFYSLKILKNIKKLTYPFVSTDSTKIISYCNKFGFNEGYIRPKKLYKDKSKIIDIIMDALKWIDKNKKKSFDAVALLQPTSPLRNNKEIIKAINLFKKKNYDSLVMASKMYQHPYECLELKKNNWNYLRKPKKQSLRRQNYKQNFYFIDGSFYIAKISFLKKYRSFIRENNTVILKSKNKINIDIDDNLDLKLIKNLI